MKSDWLCLLEDLSTYLAPLRGLRRRRIGPPATHDELLARSEALVAALHPRSMRLRLLENLEETPSTRTLRFARTDGPLPPFRPGQYVSLAVPLDGVATTRPYSISSRPGLDHLDLTVKVKPDGFVSPHLLDRPPGWEVTCSGPAGSFVHDPLRDRGPLVFLSGGSGVTPFMSMLRHFAHVGFPAPVTLLHGSRTVDDVLFGDEGSELAAAHEAFTFVSVLSEPPEGHAGPAGLLDAARIAREVGELQGASFFVCGPEGMIEHVTGALRTLGVPAHAVHRESFGPPTDVTNAAGWPADVDGAATFDVEVVGRGCLTVRADEPLLNALERGGLGAPSGCRTGECAECRMQLVAGRAFSLSGAGVRDADKAQGYVHACVAYAISDLTLDPGR
jgi:ferredoxin-NADP reductase